ncbi:hypothetical protein P4O66_012632, partial [Electrophorus voltai]
MSVLGHKQPTFLKTYGRQKRKVEQWFSPDLRKKAFSFSSSSDPSIAEPTPSKKRRKKKSTISVASRTSRVSKKRAMMALREQESDEENIFAPDTPARCKRNPSTNQTKRAAIIREPPGIGGFTAGNRERSRGQMKKKKKKRKVVVFSSSEDESFVPKKKPSTASSQRTAAQGKHAEVRVSAGPAPFGRFVTNRRRALPIQSGKHTMQQSSGVLNGTLNSSGVSFARCVTRRKQPTIRQEFCLENSDLKPSATSFSNPWTRSCEVSLNDSEEQRVSGKRPLLCSTPSLATVHHLRFREPSVSEISSLSCDEVDTALAKGTVASTSKPVRVVPHNHRRHSRPLRRSGLRCVEGTHQQQGAEKLSGYGDGPKEAEEEPERCRKKDHAEDKKSRGIGFVSAPKDLDFQTEQLKEQCHPVSSVVLVEEMDISSHLSKHTSSRLQVAQDTDWPHLCPKPLTLETRHGNGDRDVSSDCTSLKPLCLISSSSTSSSPSSPPGLELCVSEPELIDRLKVECLSSCLTVSLRPLERSVLRQAQKGPGEARVASPQPPETEGDGRAQDGAFPAGKLPDLNSYAIELPYGTEGQVGGLRRRLSNSFLRSKASPQPGEAPGKAPAPAVLKERNGGGTGRKACVSGLSAVRWSKRGMAEQNRKHRTKETAAWSKPGDCSLNYLLPARTEKHTGESLYGWMQGTSVTGLPVTPLRVEQLNLSSMLANFTPDTLTTHNWGRLKAALSIHKKTTAFPTPRRMAMSNLQSPGGMESSLDLFSTPLSKPASSRLPRATLTNTPMAHYDEDISDADKVYQECMQDGPLSFEDCIPPERMKRCSKIGEGTFGEVFSTINESNQTVALKIIPVEGCQKVNSEPQKTFGEILHEIIISKELSSLNSKEKTKTNGFIRLNNLHCVRGCYPSALLKAWDKFDQEKGSENDRPDFFSEEQLFLILEFEFGGSDLENMNGKLSSMTQAKSILHQVTAALAVAEHALCFEHRIEFLRDLHWGNILVKTTKQKNNEFILNGSVHSIETRGVHVNIIDYSLSRLEIDGLTVSCDIANDEELFMGQGDYQFEIYRLMRKENNNCWSEYNPRSNVLWLHYLADKLLAM